MKDIRSKLAVILHADVVASTELVKLDERLAHQRIQDSFHRFSKCIASYSGNTLELRGDALLAEFGRASDAVTATLAFQAENRRENDTITDDIRPRIRIGIALGEVIIADGTVTGAGVVLAQRLEQLAEPGGLCISSAVREALPARLPFEYTALGEQMVKGFDEPVRVFAVKSRADEMIPGPEPPLTSTKDKRPGSKKTNRTLASSLLIIFIIGAILIGWFESWQQSIERADPARLTQALPDRPSVAVLPFVNTSEDAEQGYFADGVTEDIITDLSKVSGLFVASRGSTFAYKSPDVKLRQVAEELGVRYVLAGSVRRSSNKIRITAQLVDVVNGVHLWSERYDRDLQDVFAVQSEVASQVVKALAVTLKSGEQERLFQKYTTNIDAYDVFIRARRTVDVPSQSNIERGEALFKQVIELDPNFAGGYAGLSFNYSVKARFGYGTSRTEETQRSLELAGEAIRIDPQFGWSYVALGGAYLAAGDPAAAVETMRQALVLLPGDYEVHLFTGLYLQFAGESAEAIKHLELAKRMNPVDTDRNLSFLGMAYFMNEDYARAEAIWTRRLEKFPAGTPMALVFLAASHSLSGNSSEASKAAERLLEAYPKFSLDTWGWSQTYLIKENQERLHRGARMAGIP